MVRHKESSRTEMHRDIEVARRQYAKKGRAARRSQTSDQCTILGRYCFRANPSCCQRTRQELSGIQRCGGYVKVAITLVNNVAPALLEIPWIGY